MATQRNLIHLRKEALKFSSAHMTVFPEGTKEALHGHNYTTEITIELKSTTLADLVSFSVFKKIAKELCDTWDEKVLLPSKCPHFQIKSHTAQEIEFVLCKKRYVIPGD